MKIFDDKLNISISILGFIYFIFLFVNLICIIICSTGRIPLQKCTNASAEHPTKKRPVRDVFLFIYSVHLAS